MTRPAEAVRDLFGRKATRFSDGYDKGGLLSARPRLFAEALGEVCPAPCRVLDFGCGTGHVAAALADAGYVVSGCDLSTGMLAEGQRRFPSVSFTALTPGWTELPYEDGHFDAVVASSVLEYVDDVATVLGEIGRILRPGGFFLPTVPNLRHPRRWVEAASARSLALPFVAAVAEAVPKLALHARFLRTSRNRLSAAGWAVTFAAAGFTVGAVRPGASPMLELFVLARPPSRSA